MISTDVDARPALREGDVVLRRRARWSGGLLIVGSGALAVAEVIHPEVAGDGAGAMATSFAERPGAWLVWSLLIGATALLQLPAVLGLRSTVVAGRGSRLVAVGGAVTATSLVALFAFGQLHGYGVALAGPAPVDPAVVEGFARADNGVAVGLGVVLALVGFHLGWPLLLAGLARAGRLPLVWAAAGIAAALGSFVADGVGRTVEAVTFVVLAVVLSMLGWRLLRGRVPSPR